MPPPDPAGRRRYRLSLAGIVVAALAWRIIYVYAWGRSQLSYGDGLFFHFEGIVLANGQGFVQGISFYFLRGIHPTAQHPPLFPLVLGGATRAVRVAGFTGDSARFHEVICTFISTGTVVAVASAARRLAGDRAGLIAAGIAAFLPALWVSDAVVMSETLVSLVVALFIVQLLRYRGRPSLGNVALLAIVAGAAALTRSELVLLFPVIVVPVAIRLPGRAKAAVQHIALGAACFAVVLAPWMIRNATTFSQPVYLTTNVGSMVAGANCPETYHGPDIGGWTTDCQANLPAGDESVQSHAMLTRGLQYARHNIGRVPVVVAARIGRTLEMLRPFDDTEDGSRLRWVAIANTFTFFPLQIAAGIGLWKLRRRRIAIWPFLAVLGIVLATVITGYGVARFRVPWDVAATVLAGVAFADLAPSVVE